jgi:hypothetical protein
MFEFVADQLFDLSVVCCFVFVSDFFDSSLICVSVVCGSLHVLSIQLRWLGSRTFAPDGMRLHYGIREVYFVRW